MPDDVTEVLAADVSTVVCAYAVLLTTVNINVVVLVTLPPVAVTVIGKLPPEVAAVVPMVRTVEQLGLQPLGENEAVAPEGSPATAKEIG